MPIDQILDRLDKVKSQGKNKWMACCPSHDDKNPSLAVSELPDGRILIKCFAGCGAIEILTAIGLGLTDLFPDGRLGEFKSFQRIEENYKARQQTRLKEKLSVDETILAIAKMDRQAGKRLSLSDLEIERQAFQRIRHATAK